MKKYMSIWILVLIVFVLCACAKNDHIQDDAEKGGIITDTNAGYEIEMINGEYYVVFEEEKYKNNVNASQVEPYLTFSSVSEMKDKVLNGKLTEEEIKTMSTFSKDETGRVKVCNFEKLYIPSLPEDVVFTGQIVWAGETYYPSLKSDSCGVHTFAVQTKELYDYKLKDTIDKIHNNKLVTITETIQTEERNAMVYLHTTSAGEFKRVEYKITTDKGAIFVAENYRLETIYTTEQISETIPYRVELHGNLGDHYFYCSISNPTERPSVEWLSSFGLVEVK
ncbi:MAG: hypothetical protein E7616_10185 [Ruminococcaceae bacterium]|nr:hypothetical protein [Oscillospiraceae bacterium]